MSQAYRVDVKLRRVRFERKERVVLCSEACVLKRFSPDLRVGQCSTCYTIDKAPFSHCCDAWLEFIPTRWAHREVIQLKPHSSSLPPRPKRHPRHVR
eukprot:3935774-Rhodomonas_salina.1